jgi:phosphoribosylformimino-5-aminoimidazole carboxamide ribotide isomerase
MQLLPAIDLRGGRVVRLRQGDFSRETVFTESPVALAARYAAAGASWLHVVDLDGARYGSNGIAALLEKLIAPGLNLQVGGGVRQEADVQQLLAAGVERVVVGSLAARDPERVCAWLTRFGRERLTIALDVRLRERGWRVASAGWTREETVNLKELVSRFAAAGAQHLLCTDIDRDGTLEGPNFELYAYLRELAPQLHLQVSGGVRGVEDIRAARASGASGVVLGRALLEGRFSLPQALAC